ncbi:MAG: GTP-binding protein [Myxococcota bacterium]
MAMANKNVINANIILYGPRGAGKTSNLQYIFRKVKQSQRGQIVPMQQEGYPHVSYEFLPMELGELNGYDTNLYIYTAPAHPDGSETRHNQLNEAAGVVFIVDSSLAQLDDNIECLTTLKEELRFWEIDYDSFPIVFQYNRRDASDALPIEELETQLNPEGKPFYEAIASEGEGVRDTFARICKMAVKKVRSKLLSEELESTTSTTRIEPSVTSSGPSSSAPQVSVTGNPLSGLNVSRSLQPPSDQTVNEAPPPRDDEEENSVSGADDLMVYDSDRPDDGTATGFGEEETTDRAPVLKVPESPSERSIGGLNTGGFPEDFLKTSIFFDQSEEPVMVGMLEVGDAEEVEAGSVADMPIPDFSSHSGHDSRGLINLPDSTSLNAMSLAQLASDVVDLNTVVEDDDEDDIMPSFHRGIRTVVTEEMELDEDEMLLDDEGGLDADVSAEDGEAGAAEVGDAADAEGVEEEAQALEDSAFSALSEEVAIPVLSNSRIESLTDEDAEELEDERSIIASPEELAREGLTPLGTPMTTRLDVLSAESPAAPAISSVQDDDDEVFSSERLTVEEPTEVHAATGSAPAKEEESSDALPDMAIAPLEEEAERASLVSSDDAVFESFVEEPEEEVASSLMPAPVEVSSLATPVEAPVLAASAAIASAADGVKISTPVEDDEMIEEGPAGESSSLKPSVTSWGAVQRVDDQTLLLPVSVRLPASTHEVELAVTIRIDNLMELLAAQSAGLSRPKNGPLA